MSQVPEVKTRTEVRDGMRILWQVPIKMDDGLLLRAEIYRPIEEGRYPGGTADPRQGLRV
jgi:uncharacterized protein